MSRSVHANNRENSILVLGKDFIQGINGTAIYAKKMHFTNFTVINKKICLSLHCDGDNGKETINFKAKGSEILLYPLCLGNVSKDFSPLNTTNTGLYSYIYELSANNEAIANDKISGIQKYLIEKNKTK